MNVPMKVGLSLLLVVPAAVAIAATTLRFSDTAPGTSLPSGWKPYAMSRHRTVAHMAIVRDGSNDVFGIDANDAAGAIAHVLDIPATTTLSWRWKVNHSVEKADLSKKSGDDFAARVHLFFDLPGHNCRGCNA